MKTVKRSKSKVVVAEEEVAVAGEVGGVPGAGGAVAVVFGVAGIGVGDLPQGEGDVGGYGAVAGAESSGSRMVSEIKRAPTGPFAIQMFRSIDVVFSQDTARAPLLDNHRFVPRPAPIAVMVVMIMPLTISMSIAVPIAVVY